MSNTLKFGIIALTGSFLLIPLILSLIVFFRSTPNPQMLVCAPGTPKETPELVAWIKASGKGADQLVAIECFTQ